MTSENGGSGVDNVAQQAAVNKLVAPKVTKYYSVGMSVTGPIKRVLRNTIEATNERLKESNELINTCAENSTPKGDAELDDLLRHRESLKKALIDLQYLPIFVESKLEIPQFLQEPNADTHSIEMRQLLVDSEVDHKMGVVRSTIGMIETELTAKGKAFSIEAVEHDPFEDSFKRAEEMNEKEIEEALLKNSEEANQAITEKLTKELQEIELLKEKQEKEMAAAQRNERLLAESQEEEQRRQHMEMEETKEAQRQANEQEKRRKEATHIAMLQEKIKTAKAAYARNNETIKSANEANLVEFFFSANSSQQKISTEEPENNRKTQANIAKSSETDILRKFHHSFQELEQKNNIAISQSIEAAITKITEGVSKSLYITEKQKQERKLHFHEEENGSVFEDELAEQYMNMGQNDQIGAYQMPENNYSTPQNPQGFTRHMPQDISSIQKEERTYKNGENSMYNQSQSYRKFDRYEKKLTPFDGSGNLGIFRRVFYDYVVENPNLTNDDKYNELARQLIGPAARCLQQLENTEEAVKLTFHELEQVYGGKIDRMDLHEKLVALPFHQTDCDRMIHDLQAHRTIVNLLKEKKLNVDDERTITPFCQKLPETILNEIMPIVNMESEKLTFIMVHDAVVESIKSLKRKGILLGKKTSRGSNEIQGAVYVTDQQRSYPQGYNNNHNNQKHQQYNNNQNQIQRSNYQGNHQESNRNWNNKYQNQGSQKTPQYKKTPMYVAGNIPKEYKIDATGEILPGFYTPGYSGPVMYILPYSFPFTLPETKRRCNTCGGRHHSIRCPLTSSEFRKEAKKKGLCELCNGEGHTIEQCISEFLCGYCRGLHFMGACPMKEFYRNPVNYPKGLRPIVQTEKPEKKTFFRGQSKHSSQ